MQYTTQPLGHPNTSYLQFYYVFCGKKRSENPNQDGAACLTIGKRNLSRHLIMGSWLYRNEFLSG